MFQTAAGLLVLTTFLTAAPAGSTEKSANSPLKNAKQALKSAGSGYLRAHAAQPIQWRLWGSKAFELAKKKKKPLFLHVGYTSCHWCQTMSSESFENAEVAKILNSSYVPVIIDRGRQPELSRFYLKFLESYAGRAGYPLNVWLDHRKKPFYAASYLPPRANNSYPMGLVEQLRHFARVYKEHPGKVKTIGADYLSMLKESSPKTPDFKSVLSAFETLAKTGFDQERGGLKGAPKYPLRFPYSDFRLYAKLSKLSPAIKEFDQHTLFKILSSSLYDQLDGGIHRYSQNEAWNRPHYEKMLSDNALFIMELLKAYNGKRALFLDRAKRIADFLLSSLLAPNGLFYTSTNADSEGLNGKAREGAWYQWRKENIKKAVSKDSLGFFLKSCLSPLRDGWYLLGSDNIEDERLLKKCSKHYKSLRRSPQKSPPGKDRTFALRENALAVAALWRLGSAARDEKYKLQAKTSLKAVLELFQTSEGHTRFAGASKTEPKAGFGDMARLLSTVLEILRGKNDLALYQKALSLHEEIERRFSIQSDGGYLLLKDIPTGVNPFKLTNPDYKPPFLVHRENLVALEFLSNDSSYAKRRGKLDSYILEKAFPASYSKGMLGFLNRLKKPKMGVAVVIGDNKDVAEGIFEFVVRRQKSHIKLYTKDTPSSIPFWQNKVAKKGKTTLYICSDKSCSPPLTDLKKAKTQIIKWENKP